MKIKLKKNINWLDILLGTLIIVLCILFFIAGYRHGNEEYKGQFSMYTVMPNDTVYSIAKDLDTNENLNKIIHEIRQDNNIEDCGNLKIGQQIKIREVWN